MDQKDVQIKNLNSLLSEALADNELNKLVEDAENTDGVKDTGIQTVPDVSEEKVLEGEETGKDVKVQEDDGSGKPAGETENSVENLKEEKEPEASDDDKKDESDSDDKDDDAKEDDKKDESDTDTKEDDNKDESSDNEDSDDKKEDEPITESAENNIPDGNIENSDLNVDKSNEDTDLGVNKDDVLDTVKSDTDVTVSDEVGKSNEDILGETESDSDVKDGDEPTNSDLEEGVRLPEGVITYKDSDEVAPSVSEDDVLDTVKSDTDVNVSNEDVSNAKDEEVGKSNEDILGEVNSASDIDDAKLNEAIERLNLAFESLHEEEQPKDAVKDEKQDDSAVPDVKSEDVLNTVTAAADLSDCNKAINDKDCDTTVPADKTYETPKISDMVKVKGLDYKTLKEAVELGKDWFDSDDKIVALKEQVAVLLAKENNDLLYEELSRLESQANAIREKIENKYSIISNNRVESLLESMDAIEQRIAANKDNMFKKLVEQQELNAAIANADTLSADEVAFGK